MDIFLVHSTQIIAAYLAYLLAVLSPGPAIMAIASTSMMQGRKAGITIAIGMSCGSLTWACSAALGLAALLQMYAFTLEILKIFGGIYLLYLAYKALRSASCQQNFAETDMVEKLPSYALLLKGYTIQVTNPKAVLTWLSIIALGLPQGAPPSLAVLIIGLCVLSGFMIFVSYATLFSTSHALRIYCSLRRWIEGAMAGFYSLAGLKLLTSHI